MLFPWQHKKTYWKEFMYIIYDNVQNLEEKDLCWLVR